MPEVTATEVRLPNPRYAAADFEPDWVRTIVLSEEKGITALIGKLKNGGMTAVRTYIFQGQKDWDLKTAQKWVDDHALKAEVAGEINDGDLVLAMLLDPDIIERYGRPETVYRDWHGRFTSPTKPPTPGPDRERPIGWFGKLMEAQKAKENAAKQAAAEAKAAAKKALADAEKAAKQAQRDAERVAQKAKADADKAAKQAEQARVRAEKEQTAAASRAAKETKAEADRLQKIAEKALRDSEKAAIKAQNDIEKAAAKAKADTDRAQKEADRQQQITRREAQRLAQQAAKEHQAVQQKIERETAQKVDEIKRQISTADVSISKVQAITDQVATLQDDMASKTAVLGSAKKRAADISTEITDLKRQSEAPNLPDIERGRIDQKLGAAADRLDATLSRVASLEISLRKSDRDLRRLQQQVGKGGKMVNESIDSLNKLLADVKARAKDSPDLAGKADELAGKIRALVADWNRAKPSERHALVASLTAAAEETEDLVLDAFGEINRIADEFYGIEPETGDQDIVASTQVGGFLVNGMMAPAAIDVSGHWDFSPEDGNVLLGADGKDWKQFARAHLLVDVRDGETAATLPEDKGRYIFPVAKLVDGKFTYFSSGVHAAMQALNGAHGGADSVAWWSPAIRQSVYKTMQSLYQREDKPAPELIMSHTDSGYGFEMKLEADGNGPGDADDGLVWKPVLREGHWAGVDQKTPIDITPEMMNDVVNAFNAGVIEHVDVPIGHDAGVDQNTGFVRALKKVGTELWAGIQFTEPSVAEKVQRGSIANVSAWLKGSFTDWRDGKKWPWVLWHVALTNKPMITELTPFGGHQMSVHRYSLDQEGREGTNMPDDIKLSQDEYDKLLSLQGKLDAAHDRMSSMEKAIHQDNVKQIVASLQGRGAHDGVKIPASMGFPAAVVTAVKPLLESDLGQPKDIKLSADGKEQSMSVTDVVLSLLNAVAAATPGALISTAPVGTAVPSSPIGETGETEEQRNKRVDGYLAARGLGPKKSD